MDPETRSLLSTIWLDGNPIFSLAYIDELGKRIYVDLTGFRPDPKDYLTKGKKYSADLLFHKEKDYQNIDQWVLRGVTLSPEKKFVYIR